MNTNSALSLDESSYRNISQYCCTVLLLHIMFTVSKMVRERDVLISYNLPDECLSSTDETKRSLGVFC